MPPAGADLRLVTAASRSLAASSSLAAPDRPGAPAPAA